MNTLLNTGSDNTPISPDIIKIWYEAFNNMTSKELIEVEYMGIYAPNEWKLMYANRNNNAGGKCCTLCEIILMNLTSLMEHNNGKKHIANIEYKVRKFRHPSIDPDKLTIVLNPFASINPHPNAAKIEELKEKLRNDMIFMNAIDMELIEFKFSNGNWNKLFSKKKDDGYVCNMCKSYTLINLKIIRNHIQTAKHKNNLDLIQGLYHPNKAPIKDLLEPQVINNNDTIRSDKVINVRGVNNVTPQKVKDFIEKHSEINIDYLLQVEIQLKANNTWEKLIIKQNNSNDCKCTLCNITVLGTSELKIHLKSDEHIKNLPNITKIHHPVFAPSKTTDIPVMESANEIKAEILPTDKTKNIPENVNLITTSTTETELNIASMSNVLRNTRTTTNTESSEKDNSSKIIDSQNKSEDKCMSVDAFRNIIPTLKHIDLIAVEFYKKNQWNKMILSINRTYSCTLCNVTKISNFNCLLDHLKGKKHVFNMSSVAKFYHPNKTDKSKHVENIISDKKIPAIITESQKESKLPKPKPLHKNSTENLSSSSEALEIILEPIEIITVEDSPEREIFTETQPLTNINLKDKENIDINNKIVTKDITDSTEVNKRKDEEELINDINDNTLNPIDNILINDILRGKDDQCSNENKDDDDVIVVNSISENLVLNPAAISGKNLNKTNRDVQEKGDIPQYQKNRIIEPRYKSANKMKPSSSKNSSRSLQPTPPNFSSKPITLDLDNNIEGLIGVEYVVKIIDHAVNDTPRYECCLCEVELGGIAMQNHLTNLKHRLKYLDRHFQTCVKQYNAHRNDGILMTEIVERIAKAVEKYHGRNIPYECMLNDYRRNRQDVMAKVYSFRHASELSGPSFTNIVNKSALDDIIRNKHKLGDKIPQIDKRKTTFDNNSSQNHLKRQKNSNTEITPRYSHQHYTYVNPNPQTVHTASTPQQAISSECSHPYSATSERNPVNYNQMEMNSSLDDDVHKRLAENFIKNTKIRELRSPSPRYRYSPRTQRSRSNPKRYGHSRSPPRRFGRERIRTPSRSPLRENDVWQAYRRKFDIDLKIIDLDYQVYNKDPQSYPLYNEEWQNFWAKRMNELKREKRDHQSYDFTSEWASYFPRRLKELYKIDVEELKVRLRERFVLPLHNRELRDQRYFVTGNYEDKEPEIETAPIPPIIGSKYNEYLNENIRYRSRSRSGSRSRSARNKNNIKDTIENHCEILSSSDEDNLHQYVEQSTKNNDDVDRMDFGPLSAVSLLRLLTALEDNLGSLGPRVVDLLSKALTLEKIKPNQTDELLLTAENCVFLETCSEKLKGQVLSGAITKTKLRAVRRAIKDVAEIINKANEERAKKPIPKVHVHPKVLNVQRFSSQLSGKQQQKPTYSGAPRTIVNKQIPVNNQQSLQPQHPTVMSQAQKKELACKLASALAAQGKTDISTEYCEKLIEVYALIDKKKSEQPNRCDNNERLTDSLTNALNSGNLSLLSTLLRSNKQQSDYSSSSREVGNSQNRLNRNFYDQRTVNRNFSLNSAPNLLMTIDNPSNQFNQLSNFDTSLNMQSAFEPNMHQLNNFSAGNSNDNQLRHVYQNILQQGNIPNWNSGNNTSVWQQLQLTGVQNLNQLRFNRSNLVSENNQNNRLSQTLLNSNQTRNNVNNVNNNVNASRIDTGAQNSPAYATGASFTGNVNNSYPNLWHRQNQQQINPNSQNNRNISNSVNFASRNNFDRR